MDLQDIRDELLSLVARNSALGSNGLSEECYYLPRRHLVEFWSRENITRSLLKADPGVRDLSVARNYLAVFSILISINRPLHLFEFVRREIDDSNLPLQRPVWPYEMDHPSRKFEDTIRQFYENQWTFCPLDLSGASVVHKRVLHPRHILPFDSKRRAMSSSSEGAVVYEVVVNEISQTPDQSKRQETLALKVYGPEQKQAFENETNMFAALLQSPSDHIVRYYGSFIQGDTYNIILENADGGNLSDFFNEIIPPALEEEIRCFWESIFNVASTLEKVHNLSDRSSGSCGWHGDIKPDNILWFKDDAESKRPCFKLADFGFANVANVRPEKPETTQRSYPIVPKFEPLVTRNPTVQGVMVERETGGPKHGTHPNRDDKRLSMSEVDIWSLGCVMSMCLLWTVGGDEEVKRFRQSWRDELANKVFNDDDSWPALYDGSGLLSSVKGMFGDLRSKVQDRQGGEGSAVTLRVLDMLQNEVLVPQGKRTIRAKDMLKVLQSAHTETEDYAVVQNDWGLDLNTRADWKTKKGMRWGYGVRTSSLRGY